MQSDSTSGVAIVHDYLTQRGGAERVVLTMLRAFPGAPVHTSLYRPESTFPEFAQHSVRTMALNRVRPLRRRHRLAFGVLAPAFSAHKVDADITVCSSSGWAHGVGARGRKVVYCHTPARWLYQGDRYLRNMPFTARALLRTLQGPLRGWDRRAAQSADLYLTSSRAVRDRIRDLYHRDAILLPPPHTINVEGSQVAVDGLAPGFGICVARLLPYKNVDEVIRAFAELPDERLVIVGTGPDKARLRSLAGSNVTFAGTVSDAQLRWLYVNSDYLVAASHEDFGITPLEAAAFAKPAAVLRFGGFLDTVNEAGTGVFFDRPKAAHVACAIRSLRATSFDPDVLLVHAETFSEERFIARMRSLVLEGREPEATVGQRMAAGVAR